nr:DUF4290 domain-containing protein [Bacteroidota bacterium]
MEYNSQREHLPIPEYGRNLQKMVDYTLTVEDREKRSKIANIIVDIMAQMHTQSRETQDFRHKLWDHLHIMANFNLDVDSPFPAPDTEILTKKPKALGYPQGGIRFHHYGRNIQMIIDKAMEYEEGPEKEALVKTIANHLKKSYLIWNRDSVDDIVITQHLATLSKNRLELSSDDQLNKTTDILARNSRKVKPVQRTNQHQSTQQRRPGQSKRRPNKARD